MHPVARELSKLIIYVKFPRVGLNSHSIYPSAAAGRVSLSAGDDVQCALRICVCGASAHKFRACTCAGFPLMLIAIGLVRCTQVEAETEHRSAREKIEDLTCSRELVG